MTVRKNINHQNKTKKITGGKVIASGGFGCILKPAIQCKSSRDGDGDGGDGVTKLLKKRYAQKEYKEITKFKPLLQQIPNYADYFLIDGFSLCKPAPLKAQDLVQFNEKCSALKKMKIDKDNVNDSLDELLAIQMPYGGIDVGDFIDTNKKSETLILLNNTLRDLLKNGILPMNKKRIYHCDLKSSNILVQETEEEGSNKIKTRLIDWGLSTTYHSGQPIPKNVLNRPFQYNVPFSVVLFTSVFTKMYNRFLRKTPEITYFNVRTFVINYILEWVDKRGPGHLKTIHSIFKELFEDDLSIPDEKYKEEIVQFDFTFYFIFEYLTQILLKFTTPTSPTSTSKKFQSVKYFEEVFLKNVDIWGFVVSYIPIMEYLLNEYEHPLPDPQKQIILKIKEMILILLQYSDTPIDTSELEKVLKELNRVLPDLNKGTKKDVILSPTASSDKATIKQLKEEEAKEKEKEQQQREKQSEKVNVNAVLTAGSQTKRKQKHKKVKYHKMIVKTLKHIKHRHSKNEWM